jgi:D-lyxose ketol-isomerase
MRTGLPAHAPMSLTRAMMRRTMLLDTRTARRPGLISRAEFRRAQQASYASMVAAGLALRSDEEHAIEVADFGLGDLAAEGAQILTLVQTDRIGAKVIALTPWQALPEHRHPRVGDDPGKEETIRHIYGDLYVYTDGEPTLVAGRIPAGKEDVYTARHERALRPGESCYFAPGETHWFLAGSRGAVLYSFSSTVRDILDEFTDPAVERATVIVEK